jgi:hypothetical protein
MREVFYAILFVFFAFLPFHLLSSPKAYSVSMKNTDPSKFELKVGKEGWDSLLHTFGRPKDLEPSPCPRDQFHRSPLGPFQRANKAKPKNYGV